MPRKTKEGGWPTRCGKNFEKELQKKEHRKSCLECQEAWRLARSVNGKRFMKDPVALSKLKDAAREWREKHPDRKPDMSGIERWRKENPEWYAANQQRAAQAMLNWQEKNPESVRIHAQKIQIISKEWRDKNRTAYMENAHRLSRLGMKWREEHPEEALRILKKLQAASGLTWISRMEEELAQESFAAEWVRETQISCGEERKKVDFVSPDRKLWVEVDGRWHFFGGSRPDALIYRQNRDAMLNQEARDRGDVTLIRLSMECFSSAKHVLKEWWRELLVKFLAEPQPGVWCFGKLYESVSWASEGCTILKLPTESTTSFSPTGL